MPNFNTTHRNALLHVYPLHIIHSQVCTTVKCIHIPEFDAIQERREMEKD